MVCCCPRHFNPTRDWKQGAKGFLFSGLSCLRVKSFPQISSRFLLTSHWKVHRGAWGNLAKGNGVGIAPAGHIVSIDKNQDSFRKEEVGDEWLLTHNKSYLPHVVKPKVIY